jgi:hypothetical protein
VSRRESLRDLKGEVTRDVGRERTIFEERAEGQSFDQFHRKVVPSPVLADLVDDGHVAMDQRRGRAGLAKKPLPPLGVARVHRW